MNTQHNINTIPDSMSEDIFIKFSSFVQSELGIKMPPAKKTMLQTRLTKRLRKLGLRTFDEYCSYVFSMEGRQNELQNMIDVVTTNKTDFFREPNHFQYLVNNVLPEYWNKNYSGSKKFMVWSAGCSTGEEPYTIAMVLKDFGMKYSNFDFSILATDLSLRVLKDAHMGVYDENDVRPISLEIKKRYLLRSKNHDKTRVRIVPALRSRVEFRQLNFMHEDYGIGIVRDIIFCRNVLIYFSRSTQEIILNRICRHLKTGGYLFIGHSETLNGMNIPLFQVAPNIYKKY